MALSGASEKGPPRLQSLSGLPNLDRLGSAASCFWHRHRAVIGPALSISWQLPAGNLASATPKATTTGQRYRSAAAITGSSRAAMIRSVT